MFSSTFGRCMLQICDNIMIITHLSLLAENFLDKVLLNWTCHGELWKVIFLHWKYLLKLIAENFVIIMIWYIFIITRICRTAEVCTKKRAQTMPIVFWLNFWCSTWFTIEKCTSLASGNVCEETVNSYRITPNNMWVNLEILFFGIDFLRFWMHKNRL